MIEIGPFHVQERVGHGAMGQVWQGRHARSGTPVAVKFVLAGPSEVARAARSVRREARAIAGLEHPGVVYVYDQGEVTGAMAAELPGVPAGSPYIVMELLSGGTLEERHAEPSWDVLASDLERILEALAHCHARGVLHRDLKPSNILFGAPSDPRPGMKLVDFGIAWSRSESARVSFSTPEFCAPEQQGTEEHAQGPWSDLYALGAITWRLVTGSLPFAGLNGPPLYLAKVRTALPALEPQLSVPAGLREWLEACLAGPPGDRFQTAPDALLHLRRLFGSTEPTPKRGWEVATTATRTVTSGASLPARTAQGCPEPAPLRREPLEVPLPPPALRDAGLSMWRFRLGPMTGRLAQRVRLWQRVEHTALDGHPRVLLLRGPPGSGRTRVGEWLLASARENGGVFAFATRAGAPGAALTHLLETLLRITPGRDRFEHALWTLEHHGADPPAVVEAVDTWITHPDDARARIEAALLTITAFARGRPVLLLFDDADADPELVEVANRLAAGEPIPVLVLLTATEPVDAAAEEVPPLDSMRRRTLSQLISNLLPLAPDSLADVVDAGGGRPGRSLSVLADALEAGRFTHGSRGITLDFEAGPPADLPAMASSTKMWLERAAVSGVFPDAPTVTAAFRNHTAAARACQDAQRLGLVAVEGAVTAFAPGVRKALLEGAGDPQRHHRALGRTLAPESAAGAVHRILGGDTEQGFAQLVQAIEVMDQGTGVLHRLAWCEKGLALWEQAELPPSPGAWTDLLLHRVDALASIEDPELEAIVARELERAEAHGAEDAVARLLVAHAGFEPDRASKHLHHALLLAERPRVRTEVFHTLARHAERSSDLPLARYWLSCATEFADGTDRGACSDAYVALGTLAAMDGLWSEARSALEEAVRLAVLPGVLDIFAANTAMVTGDLMAARSGLVRGVHWTTLRRDRRLLPGALVRLALVDLLEGRRVDASARIDQAERILAENRRQYRPDPSFGADVRLLLALEEGRFDVASAHLAHLPRLAWPKPTRVAVFKRVRAHLDAAYLPPELSAALATAETELYALRDQWE